MADDDGDMAKTAGPDDDEMSWMLESERVCSLRNQNQRAKISKARLEVSCNKDLGAEI